MKAMLVLDPSSRCWTKFAREQSAPIAAGPVAEKPLVTEAADEVRVGDARAKEIKWEETK